MPLLAATLPFLGEVIVLFALSAFVAYLCTRIRLVPIAGFLLTGVLVGPYALGLVRDPELVGTLAEIGVILLLFEIGIEFSLSKLARLKRAIGLGGGLQVGGTVGLVTGIGLWAGVDLGPSLYTGFLVALSSTAVVLGLLASRGETDTPTGQLSLSVLIFQDLAIVAMVLLVPMLAGTGGSAWSVLGALGTALAVIAATLLLAWALVPPVLKAVADTRRPELFVLVVATIALGTAWLVNQAGVSLELGAFLAGLVVSESEFSEQALSEVLPFRSLFNAVFFVSVGMLLDLSFLWQEPLILLGAVVGVLLLKAVVATGAMLALGYPVRMATTVGLALAQIGEFSFVVERTGRAAGLSPFGLGTVGEQAFIVTAVVLMLVTPGLLEIGPILGEWLQGTGLRWLQRRDGTEMPTGESKQKNHVVIVGFGPAGRRLAQVLHEDDLPFVVVDLNPRSVREARERGYTALYGDATRAPILEQAGIQRAKLCVVVINDQDAAVRIAHVARHENPTLQIVARTRFLADYERFQTAGVDIVVPEEVETTVQIFSHVLRAYQVSEETIREQVGVIRSHDYEVLRGKDGQPLMLEGPGEEGMRTRTIRVPEGCSVAGKTLGELQLPERHGLTVLAVRRDEKTRSDLSGDLRIEVGDRLVIFGTADAFMECGELFRPPERIELRAFWE
jgi:CPA2 family monovalent cation:H+ antiporter-2